ncbi:DUF2218 domain-containing protein [Streptomyces sp. NPDC086182]|uniref:DUF2218 domain-containing protein n=1 Tax=Streptomyces sp. NPDC086182 TaxID=3155058 RepID=UPI0034360ED2
MSTAEARVETDRPSRYLVQLCRHFSNKGRHLGHRLHGRADGDDQALRDMRTVAEQARVEWSDTEGHVVLAWGRITLRAAPGTLSMRAEATTEGDLRRLQDLLAGHVERFGRRDGLRVNWRSPSPETPAVPVAVAVEAEAEAEAEAARPSARETVPRRGHFKRGHFKTVGVVVVVALVLAVHLGLGGVLLSNRRWTGWAVGGLLAVVLVKVALVGGFAVRRMPRRYGKNRGVV